MTLQRGEGILQLPGQELEYRLIDGAAPCVVLLHEGLGSVSAWGRFPDQLAAATGSAVFVYSRAGYGRSSEVPLPRPLDYMQREALDVLPQVLDSLGAGDVILAGHSDGASIAAIYVGNIDDDRIRGVVLMAPHFFVEEMTIAAIARTGEAYATTDLRERLARHHGAVDVAFRGWHDAWLDPRFRAFDIRGVLGSIRVPVLVVQGEDDPYGARRQVEAVEQGCTCPVDVVMLARCGHAPHREQAGSVTDAIVAFMGRLRSAVERPHTPSPAAGWNGLPEIDRTTHAIESNERKEDAMQLGMIGLGRMGSNLVRRLTAAGHECVVYDVNAAAVKGLAIKGVEGTTTLDDFVAKLERPRAVWVMVPAGVTGATVKDLAQRLEAGDIIIDGGNSYYRDDLERAAELKVRGIHYVDCGTSGGVFGLERGYCLMIGGEDSVVKHLDPLFKSIAPGVAAAPRTPGKTGTPGTAEQGYLHCGPNGAGHFVKMVHNGIEYGLMAAYAEGLNIIKHANIGLHQGEEDAETTPLRDPSAYQYEIDVAQVAELWRRGSVVASWLLDLTAAALSDDPDLKAFSGRVSDSGEGRWTALAAIDEGVPAPVISTALFSRFESRGSAGFADQVLSAMRKQFGGHDEKRD